MFCIFIEFILFSQWNQQNCKSRFENKKLCFDIYPEVGWDALSCTFFRIKLQKVKKCRKNTKNERINGTKLKKKTWRKYERRSNTKIEGKKQLCYHQFIYPFTKTINNFRNKNVKRNGKLFLSIKCPNFILRSTEFFCWQSMFSLISICPCCLISL